MDADLCEREVADVDAWRALMFARLGFGREDVRLLVVAEADWHRAQVMLEGGCDHDMCLWILC